MKTEESKLSVIIPVYNGEKYLSRCLDTIIQAMPGEVIIVDDCSSDGTSDICCQYVQHHNIFIYRNEENRGVTYARQFGLNKSKGEYVTFVDADDWIEGGFIREAEKRLNKNNEIDIVVGRMIRDDAKGRQTPIIPYEDEVIYKREKAREELFLWDTYRWEICGKIYRRGLFGAWKSDYLVRSCEDLECTWQVFQNVNTVVCLPTDFYHYFFNENSVTSNMSYVANKSDRVFENILKNTAYLKKEIWEIVEKHYVNSLINIIRELVLWERPDQEISNYQRKIKPEKLGDRYRAIFESPERARNVILKVEREVCDLVEKRIASGSGEIYLYGTGVVADFVSVLLEKNNYYDFMYVVSDGQFKREKFREKEVKYRREVNYEDSILLTTNEKMQKKLGRELTQAGFVYVYPIHTYGIA